jgi:hypothetical protein
VRGGGARGRQREGESEPARKHTKPLPCPGGHCSTGAQRARPPAGLGSPSTHPQAPSPWSLAPAQSGSPLHRPPASPTAPAGASTKSARRVQRGKGEEGTRETQRGCGAARRRQCVCVCVCVLHGRCSLTSWGSRPLTMWEGKAGQSGNVGNRRLGWLCISSTDQPCASSAAGRTSDLRLKLP